MKKDRPLDLFQSAVKESARFQTMSAAKLQHFSLAQIPPARVCLVAGQDGPCKDRLAADLIHLHPNEDPRPAMVIGATQARRAMYEKLQLRLVDAKDAASALNELREWTFAAKLQQTPRPNVLTTLVIDEYCPESPELSVILLRQCDLAIHVVWLLNIDDLTSWQIRDLKLYTDYVFIFSDTDIEHRHFMYRAFFQYWFYFGDFRSLFESATKHGGCIVRDRGLPSLRLIYDYKPFGNTLPDLLPRLRLFTYE